GDRAAAGRTFAGAGERPVEGRIGLLHDQRHHRAGLGNTGNPRCLCLTPGKPNAIPLLEDQAGGFSRAMVTGFRWRNGMETPSANADLSLIRTYHEVTKGTKVTKNKGRPKLLFSDTGVSPVLTGRRFKTCGIRDFFCANPPAW